MRDWKKELEEVSNKNETKGKTLKEAFINEFINKLKFHDRGFVSETHYVSENFEVNEFPFESNFSFKKSNEYKDTYTDKIQIEYYAKNSFQSRLNLKQFNDDMSFDINKFNEDKNSYGFIEFNKHHEIAINKLNELVEKIRLKTNLENTLEQKEEKSKRLKI